MFARGALLAALAACTADDTVDTTRQAVAGGLVAAYGFDEGTGSTTADASGNGLTAPVAGPSWTTGKFGGALAFANNQVRVPDANLLDLSAGMTLEAWVFPTAALQQWPAVILKERPGSLSYALYASSNLAHPSSVFTSGNAERQVDGGAGLPLATWTHLAATYDGATYALYVNGALVASHAQTGAIDSSTGVLAIGGDQVWSGENFPGRIDEVRIYNRALSAAELAIDMITPITGGAPGDTTPPAVSLTAPAAGTVAGVVTVSATASDNVGVAGVRFLVDGAPIASEDTAAPYSVAWASTGVANGAHSLTAIARDAAGNTRTSAAVSVTVANPSAPSPYPLRRLAGAHHLVDQNNQPFLIAGEAAWSLFVGVSLSDAELYLTNRHAKGFNSVIVSLLEHKFAAAPPANAAGVRPFTGTLPASTLPDFSTPNEAYFAHVDAVIQRAAAQGIQLFIVPAYLGIGGGSEGWYQELVANGTTRLASYGQFLGNRYKGFPNIVWLEGGDYNPPDKTLTRAIATAIKAADPNHLHGVHAAPGTSGLAYWAGESWLDLDTVYTYPKDSNAGTPVYVKALAEYQRADFLPFVMAEAAYEGEATGQAAPSGAQTTPRQVRQQAYEAFLAGAFGHFFGSNPIWNFNNHPIFSTPVAWQTQLDARGSLDMARAYAFFAQRRWDKLVPDAAGAFLVGGAGAAGTGHATAARASDGSFGAVYLPTPRDVTIDLSKLAGSVTVRWLDPSTGGFTAIAGSPFAATGTRAFTPPASGGDGDWVLVLEVL